MTRRDVPPGVVLRAPQQADEDALRRVDAEGLWSGHASFRSDLYDWEQFRATYMTGRALAQVAARAEGVVAWAGVTPISTRRVYCGVGEVSIYVRSEVRGAGLGSYLLRSVIESSEHAGYWTLVAQIFPENDASLALHRSSGFSDVGLRRRLGRMSYGPMAGQWRDVLLLERRSATVGLD